MKFLLVAAVVAAVQSCGGTEQEARQEEQRQEATAIKPPPRVLPFECPGMPPPPKCPNGESASCTQDQSTCTVTCICEICTPL